MKILAILCPVIRHNYTYNLISSCVPVSGVILQSRSRKIRVYDPRWDKKNTEHFRLRDEAEKKWLGRFGQRPKITTDDVLRVNGNSLDVPEVDRFVEKISPNVIITLGCGLVKKDILDKIDYGLNFHLGMSPRYRGSAGLYWPIYNSDPERIATSVLVLEDNIDGGPIVHHSRPIIEIGDGIHDIAAKSIISGAKDFAKILSLLYDGEKLIAKKQKSCGRVYYDNAFHPRHLAVTDYLMKGSMVSDYIKNKEVRDKNVYFVQYPQLKK